MTPGPSDSDPGRPRGHYIRSLIAGSIGNMIEWFDWFVYTTFAIYFAGQFFPKGDSTAQLLNTAAIFAVGFLARPLGGWLLGRLADRKGRKSGLTFTVTMMSFSALLIAVAPNHATAGYLGASMLLIARILQGLSVGGEYATSAAYLTEVSKKTWRGLGGSFQYISVTLGQIAGALLLITLQLLLSNAQLMSWGWRIPFIIGAIAGVAVFYLRRGMHETEAYSTLANTDTENKRGTIAEVWKHRRAAFLVLTLTLGGSVAYYTYTTYLTTYLVNSVGLSKEEAARINLVALVVFLFLLPLGGYISDKVGRRPVLIFFGLGTTAFTYPILQGMQNQPTWLWCLAYTLIGLTFVAGYSSINAVVKAELFPTEVRTVGVAIPYNIAQAIFGGTASYIALAFRSAGHEDYFFYYVSACALISLLTYALMRETRDAELTHKTALAGSGLAATGHVDADTRP
ncbi:MFS transporter [Saccharopolyspora flava]|uniref:Putative proline/betaine transporter n=1 Tax=Saccharopolyspora flava TaxID=95161 RepID=A0A1I6UFS1_9PSEU|nr:MFS transporter [Saccharopolyspora flava]SFT00339.1 MFS transporter, MHS family, alpha-ketoglutarate permease [Saccharopolyspora flava]